jgi:hypothetical protein
LDCGSEGRLITIGGGDAVHILLMLICTTDDAFIAVLRGDYPRAAKKSALFWLGQSGTPQSMAYFDEALK